MPRKLTEFEILLVELIHYLSYGTPKELGLTLKELKHYLQKNIKNQNDQNCLECLETKGLAFINELKTYMNELEDY